MSAYVKPFSRSWNARRLMSRADFSIGAIHCSMCATLSGNVKLGCLERCRTGPIRRHEVPADHHQPDPRGSPLLVLATVMLVQFTAVVTSTIVSTATPTIVDELHGLDLYAWLFSSYLLASSVTVPVVGKLSDLFGRRPFYMAGCALSHWLGLFGALTEHGRADRGSRRYWNRRRGHDGVGRHHHRRYLFAPGTGRGWG